MVQNYTKQLQIYKMVQNYIVTTPTQNQPQFILNLNCSWVWDMNNYVYHPTHQHKLNNILQECQMTFSP